jgi:sugar lactone lactonase YvrE
MQSSCPPRERRCARAGAAPSTSPTAPRWAATSPNGLAFARNGDFLIANFGTDRLELMTRDGESRVLADTTDGRPVGKVNFVLRDSRDRIWVTVSTRVTNWMHALRTDLTDGYPARLENGVLRIVADGFGFTNEIRFDAREEFLYVVETTGGRITRLRLDDRGEVAERRLHRFAQRHAHSQLPFTRARFADGALVGGPQPRSALLSLPAAVDEDRLAGDVAGVI